MEDKKKKQKIQPGSVIMVVFFMLLGAVVGMMAVDYIDRVAEGVGLGGFLALYGGAIVLFYIVFMLHTAIHEAGHLVFGLLTGYTFSSYRIGSFMWLKEDGKLRFKRFSLAGTGGQCLMGPPGTLEDECPVVLYNLGGCLANLIVSGICLIVRLLCPDVVVVTLFLDMMVLVGVATAFINGLPLKLGLVNNDGYNAKDLVKNKEARRAFWIQMKVNEQLSRGMRVKDMDEAMFAVPPKEQMDNAIITAVAVFAENRRMDAHEFDEAEALIDELLSLESGLAGIHKNLLICDKIYLLLYRGAERSEIEALYDKGQQKFMKAMKNFLSVIRTEYALALFYDKDEKKAAEIKERWEKAAKNYPYSADIESEAELMALLEEKISKI